MEFRGHYKIEFDIKTNSYNMHEILNIIAENVSKELQKVKDYTEIEVSPLVTIISEMVNDNED